MESEADMDVELVFEAHEVDDDYEFDAARFHDFSREETPDDAREAETWFHSAKSYPPSPFVMELALREEFLTANVNVSPKPARENPSLYRVDGGQEFCLEDVNNGGCEEMDRQNFGNLQKVLNQTQGVSTGLHNYLTGIKPTSKTNPYTKASLPRNSTLMKPTASQLAKQKRFPQAGSSRFPMPLDQNKEKSLCSSFGAELQATKRQKLDGGHSHKVNDGKEQNSFVHKVSKKDETKLRLTIPREPELETAQRSHRLRNETEVKEVSATFRRFKARPFNKKMFEAPTLPLPKRSIPKLPEFQVFHLKTMERARQNAQTDLFPHIWKESDKEMDKPSTSGCAENGNRDFRRKTTAEVFKHDGDDGMHRFKALPLNKKILSSKGDIGVHRKSKREVTVPMEFNFRATERRIQQNPPTDLFSKLSLASEFKQNKGSQGSKENRMDHFRAENKVTDSATAKTSMFGHKQAVCSEISNKLQTRNWGIH